MSNSSLKITKWGNSQGIRLPMAVMELLSLKTGDELHLHQTRKDVCLLPNVLPIMKAQHSKKKYGLMK